MKLSQPNGKEERLLSEVLVERRATPHFDGSTMSGDDLATIIQAGIESPSGYNLQPWRFIVVRSEEQKNRLSEAAMGQSKVKSASVVIICCGDLQAPQDKYVDKILAESLKHGFSAEQNQKVKDIIHKTFTTPAGNEMGLTPDYAVWVNRHVMIAFTTMMWMAETLGYDTAPMEGFFEDKVKQVFDIPEHVRVVALLAIGKREGNDKPYAGRRKLEEICFAETWGKEINFK